MKLSLVCSLALGTALSCFAETPANKPAEAPKVEAAKPAEPAKPAEMKPAEPAKPADVKHADAKAPVHHDKHRTPESYLNEWWLVDGKPVATLDGAIKEAETNLSVAMMISKDQALKLDVAKQTLVRQELDSANQALMDLKELSIRPGGSDMKVWKDRYEDCKKSINVAIMTLPDEWKVKAHEHKVAHAKKHDVKADTKHDMKPEATPAAHAPAEQPKAAH